MPRPPKMIGLRRSSSTCSARRRPFQVSGEIDGMINLVDAIAQLQPLLLQFNLLLLNMSQPKHRIGIRMAASLAPQSRRHWVAVPAIGHIGAHNRRVSNLLTPNRS